MVVTGSTQIAVDFWCFFRLDERLSPELSEDVVEMSISEILFNLA